MDTPALNPPEPAGSSPGLPSLFVATEGFARSDNVALSEQPMIARVAELRVVVPKFVDARAKLDGVLVRYHAYAATLQISTAEGSPRALTAYC